MKQSGIDALVVKKLLACEFVNGHKEILSAPYDQLAEAIEACQKDTRIRTMAFTAALDRLPDQDEKERIMREVFAADANNPLPELTFFHRHPFQELTQDAIMGYFEMGETGDADMLCYLFHGSIAFDHSEQQWYLFTGCYWEPDRKNIMYSIVATRVAPHYLKAASTIAALGLTAENEKLIERLKTRASSLRGRRRIEAVLTLAAAEREVDSVALTGEEWDTNPWLLGVKNGVVNLKTGALMPGKPEDYIRAYVPHDWTGLETESPVWEDSLLKIFDDDPVMPAFMGRLLGYGITGVVTEHRLPILWGEKGQNGKGTILETIGYVLGQKIAKATVSDAIMETRYGNGSGPNPYLYEMRGKRIVWASETNEGKRLNVGEVKKLTGGDTLNTRTLHSRPVQFQPTHLLLLLTNHKPSLPTGDEAIWHRLILIPFELTFLENPDPSKPNERLRNKNLCEQLKQEASGILAWLVRGCLEWQRSGLMIPEKCLAAKSEYQKEEDNLEGFLDDRCVIIATAKVKAGEIYAAYVQWCKASGFHPLNLNQFGKRMQSKFRREKSSCSWYIGVGLVKDTEGEEVNDDRYNMHQRND